MENPIHFKTMGSESQDNWACSFISMPEVILDLAFKRVHPNLVHICLCTMAVGEQWGSTLRVLAGPLLCDKLTE